MLRISIALVEIISSPLRKTIYVRNLDLCETIYVLLEYYNDSLLILGGAILQWAVVTTAGYENPRDKGHGEQGLDLCQKRRPARR